MQTKNETVENLLADILDEIRNLNGFVTRVAEAIGGVRQAVEKNQTQKRTAAPAQNEAGADKAAEAKPDDLRKELLAIAGRLVKSDKRDQVAAALQIFGASSLREVKDADLAACIAEMGKS